jgi:hypothetical protein
MAFASTMLVLLGVMAVLLIGVVEIGGNGLMSATGNGLQTSSAHLQSATAFTLADAGVELTLQWLHTQSTPPAQTVPFAPALWGSSLSGSPVRAVVNYPVPSDSGRSFRVLIYPDAGNASSNLKKYMIESLGVYNGASQTVRAYVQLVSFAKYNYFSDQSLPNYYWVTGVNSFDGPVHCNNSTGGLNNVLWKNPSSDPIFNYTGTDAYTVSGGGINWSLNTPLALAAPQSTSDWLSVATGGATSVHVGVPVIDFPQNSVPQELAALGVTSLSGATIPTTVGVTIPHSGGGGLVTNLLNGVLTSGTNGGTTTAGIFIHGDIQEMTFGLGVSNVQTITINQQDSIGPLTTTILLAGLLNTTTVIVARPLLPSAVTFYTGIGNGMVYCDGNIGSQTLPKTGGLHGTLLDNQVVGSLLPSNHLTIATDAAKNMNIDGSLQYSALLSLPLTQPLNTLLTQQAGTLGLISNNIEIVDNDSLGLPLTSVEIDAALLAFTTCDACDAGTRPVGTFKHVGSFIVRHDGTFGLFNSLGTLTKGLSTERHYDARLVTNPPPFFPTTTGQYDVLSWKVASGTLL